MFTVLITRTFSYFLVIEVKKEKLTVGKIYAGLLILESWRTTRFRKRGSTQVSF